MRSRGHGVKHTSILLREMPVRGNGEGAGKGWESRETTMQSRPQLKERQTETERSKGGREGRLAAIEQRFTGWQACRTSSHRRRLSETPSPRQGPALAPLTQPIIDWEGAAPGSRGSS